jgi:hypothetical protein
MRVVPSSARLRRRFIRVGVALALAGAVAAIVALVPDRTPRNTAPPKNAPPAEFVRQSKYVAPTDRRAIDRTLDRFIPAALNRSDPATAWHLAGPGLRGGTTLREWRHGTSPIPYYPAAGRTFHHWKTLDAGRDYVDFDLLVQPRKGVHRGSYVFSGSMIKRNGRWLVNGLYTIAVFAAPTKSGRHEIGPADFAAGAAQSSNQAAPPQTAGGEKLGSTWLLAIGGVIVLALLFPLGFGIASVLRAHRSRKLYARSAERELPPLPRSVRTSSQAAGNGAVPGRTN